MSIELLYPWKMIGRYEDGQEIIVNGNDEEDCMYKLCSLQEKHGYKVTLIFEKNNFAMIEYKKDGGIKS